MTNNASKIPEELVTLRDFLRWAVSCFNAAGLAFGHGTDNAYDEAVYLLLHTLNLPLDCLAPFLDATLTAGEREAIGAILERRVRERIPAAYLTREAWLGDHRFYVDERVIVPRSHIAEILREGGLAPWLGDGKSVRYALDLCTGSGCLAVLLAEAFPNTRVDAVDISADALAVATLNIADYRLGNRIEAIRSDLFAGLRGRWYDLIISNPPYVTAASMAALPPEYRYEPELALTAGPDGLDAVRRILAEAGAHLRPGGILAVEVGGNRTLVEQAFPGLAPTWLESASSAGIVFVLKRNQLTSARMPRRARAKGKLR